MASDPTFPEADVNGELNPGQNKEFEVDAVSSDISTSKEIKVLQGLPTHEYSLIHALQSSDKFCLFQQHFNINFQHQFFFVWN